MVVNDNARCQPLIYTIADIRYQNSVQSQQNLQKLPVITVCGRHRTNLEHEHMLHFDLLECHQVCSSNRVCEAMGMFGIQTVVVGEPANNSLIFPLQIFRSRAKEGVHAICSYIPSASISSTDSPRRWYRHGPRLQTYPGSMIHLKNYYNT